MAVRVPDRPLLAALLRRSAGAPVVSTSANRSGEEPATTLAEAEARLGDGWTRSSIRGDGPSAAGTASALLDLTVWPPRLLRPGPAAPPPAAADLDPSGGET